MRSFTDIRLQKWHDLENRVRGLSRSLQMIPFCRLGMVKYLCSIETLSPKTHRFRNIRLLKAVTLKTGLGSVKVIGNITIR